MSPYLYRVDDDSIPTRQQLRSLRFTSPTRAVFMDRRDEGDVAATCTAIQLALAPNAVFTHLTSAALRGHHDRRGVYVRRCDVPDRHRELAGGIRVASAEWTIAELAEDLGLIDLVAVIDGALHARDTTIERLLGSIVPGRRGAKVMRDSLAYADGRSESYPEYDGSAHREKDRHGKDLRREKGMARLAYERYGYTSDEIVQTPRMVIEDAEDALSAGLSGSRVDIPPLAVSHPTRLSA